MALLSSYAYKLLIAYDGTAFFGWQRTKEGPSIQEALENALSKLLQEEICVEGCSRTDRGVHASGQIAVFRAHKTLPRTFLQGLNSLLPHSIRVHESIPVPLSFHPTLDASAKEYCYYLCNEAFQLPTRHLYSWHFPYPLSLARCGIFSGRRP